MRPNREAQVCAQLALHGAEAYAPRFPGPARLRKGSVRDRRQRWVFPGYLFFRFSEGIASWDAIRWAPGVRRVLDSEGMPAVIEEEVVDHIRARLAEGKLRPTASGFASGQAVVIERGPLTSLDAVFDRDLDAGSRVQVLVRLFRRQMPLQVAREDLRAAG